MSKRECRGLWVVVLAVVLALCGCSTPSLDEQVTPASLATKLSTIDTVQLTDHSVSEPLTIEQATEQIAQEVNEPNAPAEQVTLTLEEVRAAVLANNLDLKIELVNPAIAERNLDAERAKFESLFYGSTQFSTTQNTTTSTAAESITSQVGIEKPLPTGGVIDVGLPFSLSDADPDGVSDAAASVSVVQSLWRGAGTRINTQSIRIAAHRSNIVSARTKLTAIWLLANADVTYWRLYAARKDLEVRREQYKLAQDQLSHAKKKVAAGSAPKIEIVLAEAGVSSRLEGVINAETAVQDWSRELRRLMNDDNLPLESQTEILPATDPNPLGLDLDEQELVRRALANRMDLAQLEQTLTIDDLNVELARDATRPDLTLSYTYAARTRNTTVAEAFSDLTNHAGNSHAIGISATIPLGNRAARARLQSARLTRIQDQAARERLEQIIRQEVYEAASNLDQNWRRILAAEQGVAAALRDYQVQQSQFQLGRRTSTDVLFAATRLADAQLSRIRAFADYEIAQINLARATGTLLGYGRITLDPIDLDSAP
ncbi:MAG: TolC family protein [Sedimentisphaerales bacterium]|nr:TolC family protein [Sedimentisphaerales bacterium]